MSLVPFLKVATLGIISFTVNSFLSYLRLTVKIFQFLRLSTKFLAVLRLSVNPIETLLFVTLAYCRYILQPIVRVAFVYWFFVESNVNWSNRHAIKPGIKILNPKLYPPITNACAAQKTASGNVFCTDLQWGISPVLISHEEGLNSSISTSFLILRLYLRLRYSFPTPPPPAPAGPGRNSVPYGEAPPESGTFFRLQINNSVRISLVEVYERRGKSVNSVWKRT